MRVGFYFALLVTFLTGCSTTGGSSGVTYDYEWKNGKTPASSTVLACEEYAREVASSKTEGSPPPSMNEIVVITPSRPTEYEGEITSCGMTKCNVVLRETRSSAMKRQARDNWSKTTKKVGHAIGEAVAAADRRSREKKARQVANYECLLAAGYEKELVRYVEMGDRDGTCGIAHTVPEGIGEQPVPVQFRNFTLKTADLHYLRPNGSRENFGTLQPYKQIDVTSRKGHAWEMTDEATGMCMSRAVIDEAPTRTIITLAMKSSGALDPEIDNSYQHTENASVHSLELERYFMDVALGISPQRSDSTKLKKWVSPISVRVVGKDSSLRAELSKLMDEINALVGRRLFSFANSDSNANYTVVFGSPYLFRAFEPKAGPTNKASNWYCSWQRWAITSCAIFVDPSTAGSTSKKRSLLRRQLTTSLGLMRKSNTHRNSVFYEKHSTLTSFSEEDKQLIKWLYDERLEAGMSAADVQTALF